MFLRHCFCFPQVNRQCKQKHVNLHCSLLSSHTAGKAHWLPPFLRVCVSSSSLRWQQWKNPLLTERLTRDKLVSCSRSVIYVSFLNVCAVCHWCHCRIFIQGDRVGEQHCCMQYVTGCVVSVAVSQSVGNQVFPACSIHRGNDSLSWKTRAHTWRWHPAPTGQTS